MKDIFYRHDHGGASTFIKTVFHLSPTLTTLQVEQYGYAIYLKAVEGYLSEGALGYACDVYGDDNVGFENPEPIAR